VSRESAKIGYFAVGDPQLVRASLLRMPNNVESKVEMHLSEI
jgi:hypothetical protein